MRLGLRSPLAALIGLTLSGCASQMTQQQDVTLAIVNARVWTANPRQPWATGLAVSGERITSVGSSAEIAKLAKAYPNARIIDAKGGMVTPGFIDSHVHFITGGFRLASVQLRDAKTPQEFTKRIKEFAATVAPGTSASIFRCRTTRGTRS